MDLDGGLTGLRHTIDDMIRRLVAITVGATVVLGACGSSSPERSDSDEAADAVEDSLPDADELIDEAESLGITPLALAFDQAAEAAAHRAEIAMGMTMSLGPAGTIDFPADPATPMSFVEVDSDGEQYTRVDLAPMMSAMLGSSGLDATGIFGGDLSMETWLSGSTITIDLGGFAPMLEQNADVGVFPAGAFPGEVFTIDVARLADGLGAPEVASAITGQAAPDPVEMAEVLGDALADADEIGGDRYAGTLTLAEYSAAFGQDVGALLGTLGATGEITDGAAASMQELFDTVTVDAEVTLADGAVDTLRFDLDMSPVVAAMAAEAGGGDLSGGTFVVTLLMDYEIDPSIDVVVPTGDFPDGTDQYLELLAQS